MSALIAYFENMSSSHKLLVILLTVSIISCSLGFYWGGYLIGILLGLFILGMLWLTKGLWAPDNDSPLKSSLAVISAVSLAVLENGSKSKPLAAMAAKLLHLHTEPNQVPLIDHTAIALVLVFTLVGVYIANRAKAGYTVLSIHPRKLDKEFPEPTYKDRLSMFVATMLDRLNFIDTETKWDDSTFAPLDAEVEIARETKKSKRLIDLMSALKAERKAPICLVLGDPGGGKSVALRKLAKDLLREVKTTGRVPVYINLKEWSESSSWSPENPPSPVDLRSFIWEKLKGHSLQIDKFLNDYFDRMVDGGRFFFILDSFDEIPGVLDATEDSWLVGELSRVISEFILGQHHGRGIVSSRFFRRPRFSWNQLVVFELRPFSDAQIRDALMRSGSMQPSMVDLLFSKRPELVAVARNPFSAALIANYSATHAGALPSSQLEMHDSYIIARIKESIPRFPSINLTAKEVMSTAKKLSMVLFQVKNGGLEIRISELIEKLPNSSIEAVVELLKYSGLARLSVGDNRKFSFSHRRINEYFVARYFGDNPGQIHLESIPEDSRFRDALGLYCEVGDRPDVTRIADFCWKYISQEGAIGYMRFSSTNLEAVHCLRFLNDSFRTRLDVLSFREALGDFILNRLSLSSDILERKLCVEATGLVSADTAIEIFQHAFKAQNYWISDSALRACRSLPKIDAELEFSIENYLSDLGMREVISRSEEIRFSLSLSDAFRNVRLTWNLFVVDAWLAVISSFFLIIFFPSGVLAAVIAACFIQVTGFFKKRPLRALEVSSVFRFELASLLFVKCLESSTKYLSGLGDRKTDFAKGSWLASKFYSVLMHWNVHNYLTDPMDLLLAKHLYIGRAIIVALLLMVLPIARLRGWRFTSIKWVTLVAGSCALLIMGLIVWLFSFLIERFSAGRTVAVVLFIVAAVSLCSMLCRPLARAISEFSADRRKFRELISLKSVSRVQIGKDFASLKSSHYRSKYVSWLRSIPDPPKDDWGDDGRPNFADKASTELAQIDEVWLGLSS